MKLSDLSGVFTENPQGLEQALLSARRKYNTSSAQARKIFQQSRVTFNSLSDIDTAYEGQFSVHHKGIEFACYARPQDGAARLYVLLSGAREPGQIEPRFSRWSYGSILDGSVLSIDDPMVRLYPKLRLGWYYGTTEYNMLLDVQELVEYYAAASSAQEIVFVSSSAGGYAALYLACQIAGSVAIAINPQIRLSIYAGRQRFVEETGVDLSCNDKWQRNHLPELIAESVHSRFIIVQNTASPGDMDQIDDLQSVLGCKENSRVGIRRLAPHVLSWLYEAVRCEDDNPHVLQEWKTMFLAVDLLRAHFEDVERFEKHYFVLSELWHEHFQNDALRIKLRDELVNACRDGGELPRSLGSRIDGSRHSGAIVPFEAFTLPLRSTQCSAVSVKNVVVHSEGRQGAYSHSAVRYEWETGVYLVKTRRISGSATYGVRLRDRVLGIDVYRCNVVDGKHASAFFVNGDASNLAVLVYPNRIGESGGSEVQVEVSIERVLSC